ncbi:uncharacterized protein N7446_000701 [Penicillium canescens]|uniref:Uncharacterized protein n=1 Tax=Penicillium canescens TaxID=5083 RepID=A0AAD6N4E9_PENCN|nr:uncharacterized protein N7446_000701 [Penicillium canescens]KAJ6030238.1 hypothetical protein N7460_010504 [Penicillium canescens]KAJ6060613.1 hypothetical protein N7444_002467 [Penicillium canescens]KAJ6077765.1 hypothetical protein N7446_000701 [Penicillium canescens]
MGDNNEGESPEERKRSEKLKALQMADLGTSRREVISTHDVSRNRGPQRGQLGADRECDKPGTAAYQLARANRTTLDAWSNYHTIVTDTGNMEELDDINDGQSHRRALNEQFAGRRRPMLQLSDPQFNSPPSIGNHLVPPTSRGRGGGRAGTNRRASYAPSPAKSRTSHRGGIVKTNNQRSVTVGARLDPALNENNDGIDPQARGSGRGRNRGLDRGRARATPRQSPLPPRPPRAQRPLLTQDMSGRLSDTSSFLSIMKARSVSVPKPPAALPVSPPMKTSYHDQPLAERMSPPSLTPSRIVPRSQTAAFSKSKGRSPTSNSTAKAPIEGTGTSIDVEDLKWKISAGEFPRKKSPLSPVSTPAKKKAAPVAKLPQAAQKKSSGEAQAVKQRALGQNLLDEGPTVAETSIQTDDVSSYIPGEDLINLEFTTPPRQAAFASPSAAVLEGLDFAVPLLPFAPSPSSIYVSADAESQLGELGFSDVISTRNEEPGAEFWDLIGNTVGRSVGSALKDAYGKGYIPPFINKSDQQGTSAISRNLATKSAEQFLKGISTPNHDMSRLEQWLTKANNAIEGPSFEKHRSPHGSSPESADQKPSTRLPVPGLSPHKSEYSELDLQHVELIKPLDFTKAIESTKPIKFDKPVEATKPPQKPVPETSPSSVFVKPTGLLDSKYASEPPAALTKLTRKKPASATAKSVPHDMTSRMVSRSQAAPSRPPGLAAPSRPPGPPSGSQAMASRPKSSARVLSERTPNVHQPVSSTGVRTIGPAPSVFEPTTLRDGHGSAAPPISVRQPAARVPLQAENWSANIASASSSSDALRRVSNLTFPRMQPVSFPVPRVIGPGPGIVLPGFSPTPLTMSGDKAVSKVTILGPAPFTPRK